MALELVYIAHMHLLEALEEASGPCLSDEDKHRRDKRIPRIFFSGVIMCNNDDNLCLLQLSGINAVLSSFIDDDYFFFSILFFFISILFFSYPSIIRVSVVFKQSLHQSL